MGLQSQLNDVSSDSILLLLVPFIANSINYLRSVFFTLLHFIGIHHFHQTEIDDGVLTSLGSGFANLLLLAEQLNLNRAFSHRFSDGDDSIGGSDCVICLCSLRDGDRVRKLPCRHVIHKECFDGWLDHLHFNCPLCRSPLFSDDRVAATGRRVAVDLISWFAMQ